MTTTLPGGALPLASLDAAIIQGMRIGLSDSDIAEQLEMHESELYCHLEVLHRTLAAKALEIRSLG